LGHALQTVEPAGDFIEDAADEGGVKNLKVDFLDGYPYFDQYYWSTKMEVY